MVLRPYTICVVLAILYGCVENKVIGPLHGSQIKILEENLVKPAHGYCPDSEAIAPCECLLTTNEANLVDLSLSCGNSISASRLRQVFEADFPYKFFTGLRLESEAVTRIEDILNGVTFEHIHIDAPLDSIDLQFLNKTKHQLRTLTLTNVNLGHFQHINDLWKDLSMLPVLEKFSVSDQTLVVVPRIESFSLKTLSFVDCKNLKHVSEGAFTLLRNIESIAIVGGALEGNASIPKGAIFLQRGGFLELDLSDNNVTGIDPEMFMYPSPVPVDINLAYTHVRVLHQHSFQGFLNLTGCAGRVSLDLLHDVSSSITCDCSLAWIFGHCDQYTTYQSTIRGTCSDGRHIADLKPQDFANCTHSYL